ncbi:hypothetical protein RS9916_26889 [Synechococcus sp. RS9916]|nr:hypothetical protein RS9916_26889 [Synechococcus sp. RS9916]
MTEKQDKKQEVKEEPTTAEQVKQELSDEALEGLSGGLGEGKDFKASEPYMVYADDSLFYGKSAATIKLSCVLLSSSGDASVGV